MKMFAMGLAVTLGIAGLAVGAGKVFKGKGLQTGKPGMNRYTAKSPGETKPLPRPYELAPPLVPHSVAGLLPTRDENACLGCHLEGMEVAEGHTATKVPASHFKNPFSGERRTERVVGTRWNCLQCHAPQAKRAKPPVKLSR